ncbi:hypothetical protein AYO38_03415 [bacterium SCGC AG-212-C10]|nr:hypothetical protein AYO38_03415 [bacterium SCGC AG-212-C10]
MVTGNRTGIKWAGALLLALVALLAIGQSQRAHAATTNPASCSFADLQTAITGAGAGGTVQYTIDCTGASRVIFASTIAVSTALTIDGNGHEVVFDGNNAVRLFSVSGGAGTVFSLEEVTLQNGAAAANFGAAIINNNTAATVNITNSTLSGNSTAVNGIGGAVYSVNGVLNVYGSTFVNNSTDAGAATGIAGAIYAVNGTTNITNSTFNGNKALQGGALYFANGSVTLINNTLSGNGSPAVNSQGGGIYASVPVAAGPTQLTMKNNIIDGNVATQGPDAYIVFTPQFVLNNLFGDLTDTGLTAGVDGTIEDPAHGLGALADNGGFTDTMEIDNTSPAYQAGDDATCAAAPVNAVDQRGEPRPATGCAIGAFEPAADSDLSIAKTSFPVGPVTPGANIQYTLAITNNGPAEALASQLSVVDTLPAGFSNVVIVSSSPWSCVVALPTITCTRGLITMPVGTENIVFNVTSNPNSPETTAWVNKADVTVTPSAGQPADPDTSNNSSTVTNVASRAKTDLVVNKAISTMNPAAGATVTYRIRVRNLGPSTATNVKLTDVLPAGFTFEGWTGGTPAGCNSPTVGATGQTITCTKATMLPGSSFLVTFTSKVAIGPDGRPKNVATVTSDTQDPNLANNKGVEAASLP